ncbi:aminopeptidase P family N-terminal domain-containing protein, partial [Micromonospora sp. NPDC049580]|uniref:aminopeptidase P family N-terminal domain-containing protein n=1 Tax=Micromonospora sp. NPDC049580 TaxID=3154832 RepID=UPI003430C98C
MGTDELYPPDRLLAAQRATAAAGLDALLLTPGSDLRYLTGYDAHVGERLTCLVLPAEGAPTLIVPRLERPAAEAAQAQVLRELRQHEDQTVVGDVEDVSVRGFGLV